MVSMPDRPSSPGGPFSRLPARRRHDVPRRRPRIDPAISLSRLLLGQGFAWLALAVAGVAAWCASFPHEPALSGGGAVFWAGIELLAVAVAAGVGTAEIGMGCRMRGGPRLVVAMTGRLRGTMLAVLLIVAALLVMIGGSLLEFMALGKLERGLTQPGHPGVSCASA